MNLKKLFHIHKWVKICEVEDYLFRGVKLQKPSEVRFRYCSKCEKVQELTHSHYGSTQWKDLSEQESIIIRGEIAEEYFLMENGELSKDYLVISKPRYTPPTDMG